MTNNDHITETQKFIDERVQGRDIEKLFDTFIEGVTDTLLDEVAHPDDDDAANAIIDYIIEATMSRFNYRYVAPTE
jgi:hypothetical protein